MTSACMNLLGNDTTSTVSCPGDHEYTRQRTAAKVLKAMSQLQRSQVQACLTQMVDAEMWKHEAQHCTEHPDKYALCIQLCPLTSEVTKRCFAQCRCAQSVNMKQTKANYACTLTATCQRFLTPKKQNLHFLR